MQAWLDENCIVWFTNSGVPVELAKRDMPEESSAKFRFSSEQEEFRSNLRRLLADCSPTTEVRRLMETERLRAHG
jgi:hypothetical protein